MFFLVGWLIFRNVEKLPDMIRGWRWQLAAGVAMTAPSYFYNHYAAENGYVTYQYPKLVVEDIAFGSETMARDYPALRDQLLQADGNPITDTGSMSIKKDDSRTRCSGFSSSFALFSSDPIGTSAEGICTHTIPSPIGRNI